MAGIHNQYSVKEAFFPQVTITGSVQAATYLQFPINGEILRVRILNATSPGSVWFGESGGTVFLRNNAVASGTAPIEHFPQQYITAPTGANGLASAGSYMTPFVLAGTTIYWAGSGFTSGTGNVFGPISVYYR